jgi:hypothetical protein
MGFGLALAATMFVRKIRLERRHLLPIAVTAAIMAPVVAYNLWTLSRGATAAKLWNVGVSNVAFAIYELLGFSGLGPPRHELRELAKAADGLRALPHSTYYLIGIGALAGLYLALLRPLWKLRRDSLGLIAAGAVVLSAGAMFAASVMAGFPFWGRHLAYLLPFVVLLIVRATPQIASDFWKKCLPLLLVLVLLVSSLCQRFLPKYQKDDYRSAARMAKAALAKRQTVWWVADPLLAEYYSLSAATNTSGQAVWFNNGVRLSDMDHLRAPDLIFYSKPDVHDVGYEVGGYINQHDYKPVAELSAFRVYVRQGVSAD